MGPSDQSFPRARDEGLLIEQTGSETVAYDVERREAHALSPLAAGVFAYADGRRSLTELAALTSDRIGEPVTEAQVGDALAELEEHRLLAAPEGGVSRRSFVRRSAAVAVSVPLVTSVVLPATVLAASEAGCALSPCTPDSPGVSGTTAECKADEKNRVCTKCVSGLVNGCTSTYGISDTGKCDNCYVSNRATLTCQCTADLQRTYIGGNLNAGACQCGNCNSGSTCYNAVP